MGGGGHEGESPPITAPVIFRGLETFGISLASICHNLIIWGRVSNYSYLTSLFVNVQEVFKKRNSLRTQ